MDINRNKWLHGEIQTWETQGIITSDQSSQLSARYPLEGGWSRYLFPVLGSVLVGIGIILFFAANWQQMPVWSKLTLIFGVLMAAQYAGYHFRYESSLPWLGSGFLVMGGILFGSAIFLIAQIYNINAYWPNGILCWSLGVLLMSALTLEKPLVILGNFLLLVWVITDFGVGGHVIPWMAAAAVFLISFPLAYAVNSKFCAFLTMILVVVTVMGGQGEMLSSPSGLGVLSLLGSALFVRGLDEQETFRKLFQFIGTIVVLLTLYVLSFRGFYDINLGALELGQYLVAMVFFLGCVLVWAWKSGKLEGLQRQLAGVGIMNLLLFALIALSRQFSDSGLVLAVTVNFVLFLLIVAVIWQGSQVQNRALVNLGLVFFYLLILTRYFDFAFRYMERSLFFIIGGVLLIGLGIILNRQQHRIVEGWGDRHE